MSKTEHPQSQLSADAESFVPGQYRSGAGMAGQSGGSVNKLPHYMTSCYPFVQGDPGTNTRPAMQWQGPGRPPAVTNILGPQKMSHLQPGGYPLAANRPPGPQNFSGGPRGVRPAGFIPRQVYPSMATSPIHAPYSAPGQQMSPQSQSYVNHHHPQQQGYPYYPCQPVPGPGLGPGPGSGWAQSQAGLYHSEFGPHHRQGYYPQGQLTGTTENKEWSLVERSKSTERQKSKKKDGSNMVSIGIQNESGVLSSPQQKKKPKTRTIILMDAAIQTDFSDDIANLTLVEKPSSLFQNGWSWQDRYDQDTTTTDSEEVDSDSGYSSPLHRRNQASNGTHPVGGMSYIPGVITSDAQAVLHKQGASYPYISGPGMSPGYSLPTPTGSYSNPYLQGYTQAIHPGRTISRAALDCASNPSGITPRPSRAIAITSPTAKTEPEVEDPPTGGRKKRRRNRRRKKRLSGDGDSSALSEAPGELYRAHSSSNVSRTSTEHTDGGGFHFEDDDEFPDLLSGSGGLRGTGLMAPTPAPVSYSDILKSQVPINQDGLPSQGDQNAFSQSSNPETARPSTGGTSKESKNARKRRKRREQANRAAEAELAEISLEQQVLKEFSAKHHQQKQQPPQASPTPQPSGKKSRQPISLNIADMIDALEKQQEENKHKQQQQNARRVTTEMTVIVANQPKRGKEREVPKTKKPSPLKKVILKEREEKKRVRLLDDPPLLSPGSAAATQMLSVTGIPLDSDLSQDGLSSKASSSIEQGTCTPMSADMSPISQTSPISMSPLSPGSPLSSGINSPIANNGLIGERKPQVVMKIHSRRFREYCTQVLDKEIDACCTLLLQDLVRFQDRQFHKDPIKAKSKRRIVLGLREVTKHLKLGKIKCVMISPNLERIQSKGGLDDALNNIIDMCTDQDVPFVFALGRRALGRACAKLVPVSVVGIFNYEGSEEYYHKLMDLTEKARNAYSEMVSIMEKDVQENPPIRTGGSTYPMLYAHMGHSRTPSACSAISFTSSILSEPISENYPHSEPETDSRGYEIIREPQAAQSLTNNAEKDSKESKKEPSSSTESETRSESPNSSSTGCGGRVTIVEAINEIDEGHEADTEDVNEGGRRNSKKSDSGSEKGLERITDSDSDSEQENDTVRELPHIDSIHSSVVDLSAEILSQHSSKTLDLNTEAMSTHSSKTMGESGTPLPGDSMCLSAEGGKPILGSGQKVKQIDKDRIESWVAETQQQLERLNICGDPEENSAALGSTSPELGANSDGTTFPRTDNRSSKEDKERVSQNCNGPLCCCSVCDAHKV